MRVGRARLSDDAFLLEDSLYILVDILAAIVKAESLDLLSSLSLDFLDEVDE